MSIIFNFILFFIKNVYLLGFSDFCQNKIETKRKDKADKSVVVKQKHPVS